MNRKSWVREFAERCERDDSVAASVDVWEGWFRTVVEKCAQVARSAYIDMDNGTLPKSACRIAAADILALIEPEEGETP